MRLIYLLVFFILSCTPGTIQASSPNLYRLGVPAVHSAHPYKWLIDGLEKKGFVVGENLQIVPIDLTNYHDESGRDNIRREIANKCDLFFSGGADLEVIFKVKPVSPLLFLNIAGPEREIPSTMQANTTGVRLGSESGIFTQVMEMLPSNHQKKLGLISFKGSKISVMTPGFQKTCANLGIELVIKEYETKNGIASVMQDFKAEKVSALLLFPPAIHKSDLPELITWQNNFKLPIIGLIKEDVEEGLFGGTSISKHLVAPTLTEYAAKILQGRSPAQLPIKYFSPDYIVNLATASKLGINIPPEVLSRAEIVGLARSATEDEKITSPLLPGHFVIGIASNTAKHIVKIVIKELGKRGLVQGENLEFKIFNLTLGDNPQIQRKAAQNIATHTDLVFTTGNVLPLFIQLSDLNTPVCFIATKETAATIPVERTHNFTGVIRTSFSSTIETSQKILPNAKRLVMLGRVGSNIPQLINRYQRIAKNYDVTLDFKIFNDISEIGPLMRTLHETHDAMLLFPPSISTDDIKEIVKWQNQLVFPVFAHFEKGVKAGILAGNVVDLEKVGPKIAEYIDKLLNGRTAKQLPQYYYPGKLVINLRTAQKFGLSIPPEVTSLAEIIH